ncbi:MAG: hypothetical protein JWL73_597 [Actinomycetia bacterium]|nr:hypothetical protein [Actinomycetes bacterium]
MSDPVLNDGLRLELLRLAADADPGRHADRLWEILDDLEAWPGRRLVGDDGAEAAWFIAQRSDVDLQRRALGYLEVAVDWDDASPAHYAFLVDRIRMREGRAQIYGSQFVRSPDGDGLVPWPVEDLDHVDERRARVGLTPLAVQLAGMQARDHKHT